MKRTPEPELMDEIDQAHAYAAADFSKPHEAFCTAASVVFSASQGGQLLDLGCGPADVTVRFAKRYPHWKILGLDGAEAMLKLGEKRVTTAGLEDRIELRNVYLPTTQLDTEFDGIISNSLLHHLAEPSVLWQTISECTRAGGPIFVMDLMRPESEADVKRLVNTYASDAPDILKRDFECSLHAAYRPDEVKQQLRTAGLTQLNINVLSDRHLIVSGYR